MTHLELDGITKVYGDSKKDEVLAVDDLSIDIPGGDFLVLLGPSGCGKTTTLRMIGGLESPTEGEVRFDETVVNEVKARNRDIAMVFQDFALYPHMTVQENLGFGLRRENNDMAKDEIDKQVTKTAEMLEIEELLSDKPAQLSGGQKQRVALGRAIIREPRIFLFDEPLANLDASLRKTMRTEIDELQSKVGITAAYVTHNQEEAMTIADQIAILNDGQLQQLGTPEEVFNEPQNLFVAQFVGSPDMNLFNGTVSEQVDTYQVNLDATSFSIPKELIESEISATDITVGFRPQDLYQNSRRSINGPSLDTEIRVVEPIGTEAIVHTDSENGAITAKVGDFHNLSANDGLTLTIAPEHVYLFDPNTEALIKGRLMAERADESSKNGIEI